MGIARTKLVFALTGMTLAVGYLGFATFASGWTYYVDVDGIARLPQGERARVRGKVGDDPQLDSARLLAEFQLCGASRTVEVRYRGALPESFAVGREVVVEGVLDSQGVLQAETLMTKCSSKYEPAKKHSQVEQGRNP